MKAPKKISEESDLARAKMDSGVVHVTYPQERRSEAHFLEPEIFFDFSRPIHQIERGRFLSHPHLVHYQG